MQNLLKQVFRSVGDCAKQKQYSYYIYRYKCWVESSADDDDGDGMVTPAMEFGGN